MAQGKFISSISRFIDRKTSNLATKATVIRVDQLSADITLGPGSGIIRNVEVLGNTETLLPGMVVTIEWRERQGGYLSPIILHGNSSAVVGHSTYINADGVTLQMYDGYLRVKPGGIGLEHLNFLPALADHSHPDPFLEHGWSISADAIQPTEGNLKLYSDGRIYAGINNQVVIIDTTHENYRMWAGYYDPEDAQAVFKIGVDGKLYATAGEIGGWNIGTEQLDADSGQAILNSAVPFLGLGGADAYGEAGVFLGKDNNIYKVFVGNPLGSYLSWNGQDLVIVGDITATSIEAASGSIGGWTIGANALYAGETTNAVHLNSNPLEEYAIWAGDEVAEDAPFRVGKNGILHAYAGYIGSWMLDDGNLIAENGDVRLDAINKYISVGGPTSFMGGTGFWAGLDGSTPKLHIGNPQSDFVSWDGTTLTVTGALFSAENIIGVIGGSLMITKDRGQLPSAVTAAQTQINFGRPMTLNDYILIKARDTSGTIRTEYMQIGALVSGSTYNVSRGLNNSGVGYNWPQDTIFVVLGQNGDGHISLDAYGAPQIVIKEQLTNYDSTLERIKLSKNGLAITFPDTQGYEYYQLKIQNRPGFGSMYASIGEVTSDACVNLYADNGLSGPNWMDSRSANLRVGTDTTDVGWPVLALDYRIQDIVTRIFSIDKNGDAKLFRHFKTHGGLYVGNMNGDPGGNGKIKATSHITTDGSFYAGNKDGSPSNGEIWATQRIHSSNYMSVANRILIGKNGTQGTWTGYGALYADTNGAPRFKTDEGRYDLATDEISVPIKAFTPIQGASSSGVFGNHMPDRIKMPKNQSWPAAAAGPFTAPLSWSGMTMWFDLYFMVSNDASGIVRLGVTNYKCDDYGWTYQNANVLCQGSGTYNETFSQWGIYKLTIAATMPTINRYTMFWMHVYRDSSYSYANDVYLIGAKVRSRDT